MQFRKALAGLAVCASLGATGAQAGVVFTDNFNTENGGVTALNWGSFNNFGVSEGTVDIVFSGDYSLNGGGSFVDLDGSTRDGGVITTLNSFAFSAGDVVSLTWEISGNQRGCCDSNDDFFAGFIFGGATDIAGFSFTNFWAPANFGDYSGITGISSGDFVANDAPWRTYGYTFQALTDGTLKLQFGTNNSNDNVGPLLDNVSLSIGAVPEPATWAMMIMGFGAAGAMLRRRALTAA